MPTASRYVGEAVAALFLTLAVLGAAAQDLVLGALAIAAAVGVVVWAGAHANPVLTLATVVARRLPAGELLPFWAAQLMGALLAAALARWLLSAPAVDPLRDVGVWRLLVVEALFAFALCWVALDEADWSAPAAGATVLAAAAVLDPVAGAAFNPAAAFGQVVAGLTGWGGFWVYGVACPAGAVLAGLVGSAGAQPRSRPG